MTIPKYEITMKTTDQILGYSLYLRDWTIKEIAVEIDRSQNVVYGWVKKFDWRTRKARELRNIEDEMREKTLKARGQIIEIGTQTLGDVFIHDTDGNVTGVTIAIEDVRDLKVIAETILKAGGVPDKVEQKVTKEVTGELSVKTETIDSEMAAEIGRLLALRESAPVEGDSEEEE